MSSCRKIRILVLLAVVACLLCGTAAFADDKPVEADAQAPSTSSSPSPNQSAGETTDENWHFTLTPYLWFPGVTGTVGAVGHDASVHATPGDLLSHFDIGLMGAGELRKNRFLLPLDFMWIKMTVDHSTPFDPGVSDVKVKLTQTIFTPGIGYRILDHEKVKVDARIGLRYWHLGQNLSFSPSGILDNQSISANWVDGVAGGNIQAALSPKVLVTVLGDAGGGQANLDYQAAGLLGFKVSQKIILQAGWRYLYVNYRTNLPAAFVYNVHMSGALLGVTWDVK